VASIGAELERAIAGAAQEVVRLDIAMPVAFRDFFERGGGCDHEERALRDEFNELKREIPILVGGEVDSLIETGACWAFRHDEMVDRMVESE